ncbi:MAG: hypothetical protein KAI14_03295 [Dehalococcoidales bacterium]|nr:hypothetical protein [Dehalococcoidales bacterium]
MLSILVFPDKQGDNEGNTGDEEDDATGKVKDVTTCDCGGYEEAGTHQEQKPTPKMKPPSPILAIVRHGHIFPLSLSRLD